MSFHLCPLPFPLTRPSTLPPHSTLYPPPSLYQAWKIPPCISNWKNARGYTIPLDKRLAADGRGLQEVTINNKFAMLSESLYVAERKASEDLRIRNQIRKKMAMREKEDREKDLRDMALRARMERAGALDGDDIDGDDDDNAGGGGSGGGGVSMSIGVSSSSSSGGGRGGGRQGQGSDEEGEVYGSRGGGRGRDDDEDGELALKHTLSLYFSYLFYLILHVLVSYLYLVLPVLFFHQVRATRGLPTGVRRALMSESPVNNEKNYARNDDRWVGGSIGVNPPTQPTLS